MGALTEVSAAPAGCHRVVSLPFGSVSWSQRFFAEGKLSAKSFAKAEVAANAVIEEHLGRFAPYPRDHVYGASGTMGAVAQALSQLGGEKQNHHARRR